MSMSKTTWALALGALLCLGLQAVSAESASSANYRLEKHSFSAGNPNEATPPEALMPMSGPTVSRISATS